MKSLETTKLLKEFAKEKGIDEKEVDVFMENRNNPKTLNDIINMPSDLTKHYSDLFELPEILNAFVKKEIDYLSRNEIVDSDRFIEIWCDSTYHIMGDTDDDLWDFTLEQIEELKPEFEEKTELMNFYKEVAKAIFEEKFGSFKNDW
ncbi:DUF7020 family protein [Rossellomorea marisflavi]|uniref:DUF7020 family protein n=1 Tax=Rossellomorea marisflavi TaxID=189381 RepID=UPI003FA015DA